jgi:hypothetical protein
VRSGGFVTANGAATVTLPSDIGPGHASGYFQNTKAVLDRIPAGVVGDAIDLNNEGVGVVGYGGTAGVYASAAISGALAIYANGPSAFNGNVSVSGTLNVANGIAGTVSNANTADQLKTPSGNILANGGVFNISFSTDGTNWTPAKMKFA